MKQIRQLARVLLQTGALILIWLLVQTLSVRWLPFVPPTVLGIVLILLGLSLGLLRPAWLAAGAGLLLREMLLFFIPVAVALMQYLDLLRDNLLAILAVVLLSTACVMLATAAAVSVAARLESRWRKRQETI
jgi:holin-like protein